MTPLSQKCGEKQGGAFKVGPHLSFLNLFNTKKHFAGHSKKLSIYFFVYSKQS